MNYRVVRTRLYDEDKKTDRSKRTETDKHPLIKTQSELAQKSTVPPFKRPTLSAYSDPLTAALEGFDPLSQFISKDELYSDSKNDDSQHVDISEEWLKQRTDILSRFTTSEKLSITSSFLQGGEKCRYFFRVTKNSKVIAFLLSGCQAANK